MTRLITVCTAAVFLMVAAASGCKKDEPKKAPETEEVAWPPAPAGGAPLAARFVKMVGEGKRRGAEIRFFNYREVPLVKLEVVLHYLDKDGKALGDFPYTTMAPSIVEKKGHSVLTLGGMVPANTVSVGVTFMRASFKKGAAPDWVNPSGAPEPAQIMGNPPKL